MKTASRTLVKSAPEVWEQLDDPGRMQGLMSALVGHATEVDVYERVEESKLAWRSSGGRIEVELAEKGWGTKVSVSAENGQEPTKLEGWLDAVLEELATPQKRPFEGMSEAPAGTLADAFSAKPKVDQVPMAPPIQQTEAKEPKDDDLRLDESKFEAPATPPEPKVDEPQPRIEESEPRDEPRRSWRRFFGFD